MDVVVLNSFTLTVDLEVGGGGPPGTRMWDVRVTNTDQSTGVLAGGLLVVR